MITETAMPDLLAAIVAATRRTVEVRARTQPTAVLERLAAAVSPRGDRFRESLAADDDINVIAECKRRSPSRDLLREDYDPAAIARAYADGGAAAISVLTEPTFFDGSLDDLRSVRRVVDLPLLRKDFIVTEYQLLEARAAGADAALLIAGTLDDQTLRRLIVRAGELGLAALVEVHDAAELDRALGAGAAIVGVNSRNLRTLAVDVDIVVRLAPRIPADVVSVAESGLRTPADLARARAAGYRACLVGESLISASDPGAALTALRKRVDSRQ